MMKQPGKWLGVAENVDLVMSFWMLPLACITFPCSFVVSLSPLELGNEIVQASMENYILIIENKINNHFKFLINTKIPTLI